MRVFSFGGGVQSTAALVLAAQGKIDFGIFLFANVGDDSENPDTLDYVRQVAMPYALANGIELHELQRTQRNGQPDTLLGMIAREQRSIVIPARMAASGAPARRACTSRFKINVIAKWQKQHGATVDNPAVAGLGISTDEFQRARTDSGIAWQVLDYPLLRLQISRRDCQRVISEAGLPVPPKSSCYFCPYHNRADWQRLKTQRPDLFERAVALEKSINQKQTDMGRDGLRLHPSLQPLEQAVGDQMALWKDDEMENCESGYCMV